MLACYGHCTAAACILIITKLRMPCEGTAEPNALGSASWRPVGFSGLPHGRATDPGASKGQTAGSRGRTWYLEQAARSRIFCASLVRFQSKIHRENRSGSAGSAPSTHVKNAHRAYDKLDGRSLKIYVARVCENGRDGNFQNSPVSRPARPGRPGNAGIRYIPTN